MARTRSRERTITGELAQLWDVVAHSAPEDVVRRDQNQPGNIRIESVEIERDDHITLAGSSSVSTDACLQTQFFANEQPVAR